MLSKIFSKSGWFSLTSGITFSLPISAIIFFWKSSSFSISFCANSMARRISSSGISLAPASTMFIFPALPQTTKSKSEFSSPDLNGFITNSPFTFPTRTPPIGPSHGMEEVPSEREAASIAGISGSFSPSKERAKPTTCTSFLILELKRGLKPRSISRDTNIASSDGLPSLRIKREPPIIPAA